MLKKLIPTYFEENIYKINFKKYYKFGYRHIIFDIDNTLVIDEEPVNKKILHKINEIKKFGFVCSILSNNYKSRVKKFADDIGIKFYIYKAKKPRPNGFLKLIKRTKIKKEKTLYIGDQLFTDVLGANNINIDVILVKQLGRDKHFYIRVKRFFEIIIEIIYLNRKKNA